MKHFRCVWYQVNSFLYFFVITKLMSGPLTPCLFPARPCPDALFRLQVPECHLSRSRTEARTCCRLWGKISLLRHPCPWRPAVTHLPGLVHFSSPESTF